MYRYGGPSQSWFDSQFLQRGVQFKGGMHLWEIQKFNKQQIYGHLPKHIAQKDYHYYNIPCSAEVGHKHNPLDLIKRTCKKSDFVVFKLDIDTPSVEIPLVRQLLVDDDAVALIDEMFFEYHVREKYMGPEWFGPAYPHDPKNWWGGSSTNDDLEDAYKLFSQLRARGLRIHSWV